MDDEGAKSGVRDASPTSTDAEDVLVARIINGDRQAFEQLYRGYHPRLWRFLSHLLKRPPLVEEALNDTMMVVWRKMDSFAGKSRLSTWVFGIAYRQGMSALRRHDEPMEDRDDENDNGTGGPEQVAGRTRAGRMLAEAIAGLSPAHRAVVDLTYGQEFGYREIATILDCPVDTVKTRMFHARRQLRLALPGDVSDWL
jgi:RNA polymerase sigma-70 factor (ECF subfamily)